MTEKQIERVQAKIQKLKKELANDKKRWGGYYDDSRGLRYGILELYIKIADYKGGLRYVNWFEKNFPEDTLNSFFTFECGFILYQSGKHKEAKRKIYKTFFNNPFLLPHFLGLSMLDFENSEYSAWQREIVEKYFKYHYTQSAFTEFAEWVNLQLEEPDFISRKIKYIQLNQQLKDEPVGKKRSMLVNQISEITNF